HRRTPFFHSSIKVSILLPADLEDHASTRDLHQRSIFRIDKTGGAAGAAAGVPHRAVIDDIGALVWPEPDISRPVECGGVAGRNECLFAANVEREILEAELQWAARVLIEVDQLDFVTDFRGGKGGVRWREPEIALETVESRTGQDRAADERSRREVDAGERRICRLDRDGGDDGRRPECQHIGERDNEFQNIPEARWRAEARRIAGIEDAEIIAGSADRIEYRLTGGKEAVAVGPTMIDRCAVGVLEIDRQHFWGAVRGSRTPLIRAVLAD